MLLCCICHPKFPQSTSKGAKKKIKKEISQGPKTDSLDRDILELDGLESIDNSVSNGVKSCSLDTELKGITLS